MVELDELVVLNFGQRERECLKVLIDHGVRFLLVGGYAVRFHGHLRSTTDVDVLVSNDRANAKRLCSALIVLMGRHPKLRPEEFAGRKRQVRLFRYGYRFEILTAADGVPFEEVYERRCQASSSNLIVPVIAKDDLIDMKAAAGRAQDIDDVERLRNGV